MPRARCGRTSGRDGEQFGQVPRWLGEPLGTKGSMHARAAVSRAGGILQASLSQRSGFRGGSPLDRGSGPLVRPLQVTAIGVVGRAGSLGRKPWSRPAEFAACTPCQRPGNHAASSDREDLAADAHRRFLRSRYSRPSKRCSASWSRNSSRAGNRCAGSGRRRAICGRTPRRPRQSSVGTPGCLGGRTARPYGFSTSARPASNCRSVRSTPSSRSSGSKPVMTIGTRYCAAIGSYSPYPMTVQTCPGPKKPWTRLPGASRIARDRRRHQHVRHQHAEIRQPPPLRLPDGHGVRRRGRLEPDREEDDLAVGVGRGKIHGVERRIDDPDVAPLRLELQQVAPRAGYAQHVAKRAENDVRPRGDGVRPIDHLERRHADRAARPVNQLDARRNDPIEPVFDDRVRLAAAYFHDGPGPGHGAAMAAESSRPRRGRGIRRDISCQ